MIDVLSKQKLDLDYLSNKITSLNDSVNKIIIIDESIVSKEDIFKFSKLNKKKRIIVICKSNRNFQIKQIEFTQNKIDYYLRKETSEKMINAILKMYESKYKLIVKYTFGDDGKSIIIDDQLIRFSKKELKIFLYLSNNHSKLCYRKDMLTQVLQFHESADTRIVDVYIRHIREKLTASDIEIETVRGKGYILK